MNNWKDAKSFVCSMTLDENTGVIYSGGYDGCIRGYHVYHKDPLFSVSAHSEPIVSIDSSNHLGRLVSGAQDGFAREWDIANPSACYKTIVSRSRGEDIPM